MTCEFVTTNPFLSQIMPEPAPPRFPTTTTVEWRSCAAKSSKSVESRGVIGLVLNSVVDMMYSSDSMAARPELFVLEPIPRLERSMRLGSVRPVSDPELPERRRYPKQDYRR